MRSIIPFAVAIGFASLAAAQDATPKKPNTLTLSGCVQKSEIASNQFTLADGNDIYRLTGMDVREFLGRRVQVVGGAPKRLKIAGGLKPSPNIAGQAGAIDPARAATAVHDSATINGTGPEMEVRVRSIKAIDGSCAP
jgi:hypothetical protein